MSALLLMLFLLLLLKSSSYWFETTRCQLLVTRADPLDVEVLIGVAGCARPIRLHDWMPPMGYLLSRRVLHSRHLFLGAVPWWTALLPRDRVWVLMSGETGGTIRRAGRVLCRSHRDFLAARATSNAICQEVGFTSLSQREPDYPSPAAGNPEFSVLCPGGPTPEVRELWARHPELPPLHTGGELASHPVHLCPRGSHSYRLAQFHGALTLDPKGELLESLRALAGMTLQERTRAGRRNQLRFRRRHRRFLKLFPAIRPEVFFFTTAPPARTGGHLYNREMIGELRRHQISVQCCDLDLVRKLVGASSKAASVPFSLSLMALVPWRRQLLVLDQVFAHVLAPALAVRAVLKPGKTVVVLHHMDDYESARAGWFSRWRHRAQLWAADRVITVSQYCREEIASLGISREKIKVISGGARVAAPPAERSPGKPIRLLFVGQLIERKGLPALLQALARLDRQAFRLCLVGDNESLHYRSVLGPMIEELQLDVVAEGRVSRERLLACYREADAFVFPSLKEGYGLAVLEAMLAGLPILCSRTTALPELVQEGHNGYLFEPGNPEDIARALQRVLDEPQALVRMGKEARARGLREPTWKESRARFFKELEPLL